MPIIKDLQLYKENNQYYLSALFDYEDKRGFYELSVPKIKLPIFQNCELNINSYYNDWDKNKTVDIDFGFGILNVKPFNDKGDFFIVKCLDEKIHKMTLAEIEKELGYKIELKEN